MGENSTTGKHRTKRPDFRANAKKRKQEADKAQEKKEGVTYASVRKAKLAKIEATGVQPGERKFDNQSMKMKKYRESEKLVRALTKKLRHIDELIKKKESGAVMDEQQLDKIDKRDEVLLELEGSQGPPKLKKAKGGDSEEEEDEDEDEEEEDEGFTE
eukprot:CAMPEP_0198208140 /NCGR_PEP_ID=MMETSP1445-20131203/11537_1 /TAXON_ID=36898 /ORGANISM="Pyramimonas sp., Strain CCMP2087" /LENGTH=157 /DNA_ID=CAMNT_0043881425 /DNA_START=97 /DNA_END=570 /DNA_ORIENTATION=+